jgi:VWFA-related protein
MKSLVFVLITSVTLVSLTAAQTPAPETFFVSVMNKAGQYIPNLKAEDFILEENGSRQPIASFKPDSDAPVSLGILIDKSASMRLPVATQGGEKVSAALLAANGAAKVVLKLMKPNDEYLLMTFDDVFNVKQNFTSDEKKMSEVLSKNLTVGGSTRLYRAIEDALKETSRKAKNRRKALIVITDVHDTSGDKVEDLQATIRAQEIPVYTFGMRWDAWGVPGEEATPGKSTYEEAVLKMMAVDSGGFSMVVDIPNLLTDFTISRMIDFVSTIAVDLRGQYTLTYNPSTRGPGNERAIRIRSTTPDYQVRFSRDLSGKPGDKK